MRFKDRFCDDKHVYIAKVTGWIKEEIEGNEEAGTANINDTAIIDDELEIEPPPKKPFNFFDAIAQTSSSHSTSASGMKLY